MLSFLGQSGSLKLFAFAIKTNIDPVSMIKTMVLSIQDMSCVVTDFCWFMEWNLQLNRHTENELHKKCCRS